MITFSTFEVLKSNEVSELFAHFGFFLYAMIIIFYDKNNFIFVVTFFDEGYHNS